MATALVDALAADAGLVCVVGAGGKKTTLYALARELERAVVTATVRIPHFDSQVARVDVTDDPIATLRAAAADADGWPRGVVRAREQDRYLGYPTSTVSALAAAGVADTVLVKADGARTRWFKAPAAGVREPRIPATADTVVPIVSARVVGEPLTEELVHRPQRVAALTNLSLGDPVTPAAVAEVLTHRRGGLKFVPARATAVPLVNMVDDAALEDVAREVAAEILTRRPDLPRVALARMDVPELVAVVE